MDEPCSSDLRGRLEAGSESDKEIFDIEDILNFSSGSSDYFRPDEDESDDSRHCTSSSNITGLSQLVTLDLPGPSGTSCNITATIPQADVESDDESVDVVQAVPPPSDRVSSWIRVYGSEPIVDESLDFIVRNPGPRHCPIDHDPINYLQLFLTVEFFTILCRETNAYSHRLIEKMRTENTLSSSSRFGKWIDVTISELRKFIAIMLAMGVCRRKNISTYWSMDEITMFPFIRQLMTQKRFEIINRMLCLTSRPTLCRSQLGYDPWIKIRPFLDQVNNASVQHYAANQNLCLEESMIGMKNQSTFIQSMPKKRHARYGIKKSKLVDVKTMYVMQISLYTGKDYLGERPGPFTQKVVLDLLEQSRCLDKGYHIFTDNYYTNLPLARALLDRKTFLTCTINKRSVGLPKMLFDAKLNVLEPVYYRKNEVLLVGFKEKPSRKPIILLSTACEAQQQTTQNSCGKEVVKPVMINKYNKNMGGVDCKDKSLYHYSCTRSTKRYCKKIFFDLLDTCVQNAYVLYSLQCEGVCSVVSSEKFIFDLIRSLSIDQVRADPVPSTTRQSFQIDDNSDHNISPLPLNKRRLCGVCGKAATYWCPGCNCGVHKYCFHLIEHKFRPTFSRKRPIVQSD